MIFLFLVNKHFIFLGKFSRSPTELQLSVGACRQLCAISPFFGEIFQISVNLALNFTFFKQIVYPDAYQTETLKLISINPALLAIYPATYFLCLNALAGTWLDICYVPVF